MINLAPSARLARWRTSRYASTVAGQARGVGMRKYAKIFGAFSMSFALLLGASHAQEIAVTAIDILLEPDTTMVRRAQADNTRLLNAYPKGFALDATISRWFSSSCAQLTFTRSTPRPTRFWPKKKREVGT